MGAAVQVNNKLPDGRKIRALKDTFTQVDMFSLRKSGLFVPKTETIMTVKEHDRAILSGAYKFANANNWWRTAEYGFYPRGFENKTIPLGNKLVYVEYNVAYTLQVPDVPVKVNGKNISLRKAVGMGVIPLEKLEIEKVGETNFTVSVSSDFNPVNDVKVVDIMRPRGWALVDSNGYPLKSRFLTERVREARDSYVRHTNEFDENATGWHGSLARAVSDYDRNVYGILGLGSRVFAAFEWFKESGVALVGREATAPKIGIAKAKNKGLLEIR